MSMTTLVSSSTVIAFARAALVPLPSASSKPRPPRLLQLGMILGLPGRLAPIEGGEQQAAPNFLAGDLREKRAAAPLAD
jgi:hypothetical protein